MFEGCPKCKTEKVIANLTVTYNYDKIGLTLRKDILERRYQTGIWKYMELLPVMNKEHMLSLCEGDTPLLKCKRLGKILGIKNLYVKDESRNPTWSYKDRLCCVAIAKGLDFGAKISTVSTTGNHGAATAAYSAIAGMDCVLFTLPIVPKTMLTLMQVYGAKVVSVPTFEGRWKLMAKCVKEFDWYPLGPYNSMVVGNPYGTQGYKTIGFEICEQLNWRSPNKVIMPTGYGEGLFGTWSGFKEFHELKFIRDLPQMVSIEPANGAPLTNALSKGLDYIERIPRKSSVAVSIAGNTTAYQSLKAIWESNGFATTVEDREIMDAQRLLASKEGVYAEPSSAASIAGIKKLRNEGKVDSSETVVCVITSSGLKDVEATRRILPEVTTMRPDWQIFLKHMNKYLKLEG